MTSELHLGSLVDIDFNFCFFFLFWTMTSSTGRIETVSVFNGHLIFAFFSFLDNDVIKRED